MGEGGVSLTGFVISVWEKKSGSGLTRVNFQTPTRFRSWRRIILRFSEVVFPIVYFI